MYRYCKRALDLVLSTLGMAVLFPLFLVLVAAIKLNSPGPVFFRQKRFGRNKTFFSILKFRTMRVDTPHDVPTHQLTNPDYWITGVGRFLRKTSLDELPQLWNIFRGEMSVVGPRPALWNQEDLIRERDRYVGRYGLTANQVRPGLTGWAQINGRDELPIERKAQLDGEYVAMLGLRMDARCVLRTFLSVLRHEGVVEGGTGALPTDRQDRQGKDGQA
jgi:O-antigen biosynthesis protein WbqP